MRKPSRKMKANLLRAAAAAGRPLLGPPAGTRALPQPEVKIQVVCLRAPRPRYVHRSPSGELAAHAAFPWRCADDDDAPFVVLDAGMRLADVAAVARALCVENRVLPRASAEETFADLLEVQALSLPGGMSFLVDGARVVTPGCCVGVESWRGWSDLLDDGSPPWGGHDPFASATTVDREVHVFSDAGAPPRLVLERGAYGALLLDVERDLLHFVRRLEGWLVETAPSVAHALAAKVARDLRIVPG